MGTIPAVSERLRAAIQAAGVSRYRIAQECGVAESVLSRFVRGERGLDLPTVDRVAAYLGLDLVTVKNAARAKGKVNHGNDR
jgi:transcriptional regulator with XRE-family HTH domain